ncbi:hypothetical protein WN944_000747 [Citrus x changshan-huyou]|uniref:Uncharacterized protein n=1 Tax=Citrus x changshan-huyou TaxID=2935761 RepID=A0AAP0QU52_9ROSI
MQGVVTWRMLLTEKEPEVHSGMVVWSGGRSRVAVGLMRLIRPQFSNNLEREWTARQKESYFVLYDLHLTVEGFF